MKRSIILRAAMVLTLFFGVMSAAWADDRLYMEAVNIEPGETKTLTFCLDNSQEFYGFQADITLPEGIAIVEENGKPVIFRAPRLDASYNIVTNLLSSGSIRIGAFSFSHNPINDESGALFFLTVKASEDFTGGTVTITDILFIDSEDRDVEMPDFNIEVGNVHDNRFYIPDFTIAVGETRSVSMILDNETPFTAFQTDIYMPEGLSIVPGSFVLSTRASGSHAISFRSYSDGRTRLVCMALGANSVFAGNSGELVTFEITADKNAGETCEIDMRNQLFSRADAKEVLLPNSITEVTTQRTLVESITLDFHELSLHKGDSEQLEATVLPSDASDKDVKWESLDPDIAFVDENGVVTGIQEGETIIRVSTTDGSELSDECHITVIPSVNTSVEEISLDTSDIILDGTRLIVKNLSDYTVVSLYGTDGLIYGSHVSAGGVVTFEVSLDKVYILKIGDSTTRILTRQ